MRSLLALFLLILCRLMASTVQQGETDLLVSFACIIWDSIIVALLHVATVPDCKNT